MLTATELAINRANTDRFIASDPTIISLIPRAQEHWVNGTRTMPDATPRPNQIFKVIWAPTTGIVATMDGTTRRFDFVLVGSYNAVAAVGDHWVVGRQKNEIDYVYPFNGYEFKCGGSSYGIEPAV